MQILEKPVGLVYLACACGSEIKVERHIFDGDRQQVRHKAVGAALKLVEQVIQQEYK